MDSAKIGFSANQLSVLFSLIGIHSIQSWIAIARHGGNKAPHTQWVDKCLKIPLNSLILLFKFLMVFNIQGPGQVLLNSGSPPLIETQQNEVNSDPFPGTIPENYFGW